MPLKSKINALTIVALTMGGSGCSSLTSRFSQEDPSRGKEFDYFSSSFKGNRYYIGARAAANGQGPMGSFSSYGNTGKPSDALSAIILAVPILLAAIPKVLVVTDVAASGIVDTALLPLDFSLNQIDSPQAESAGTDSATPPKA